MEILNSFKYLSFAILITLASCTSRQGMFGSRSAHEKYSSGLEDAGLLNTRLAREWRTAAESAIANPAKVSLPYSEAGYFDTQQPRAAGYVFSVKRGEKIRVDVKTTPVRGFLLFLELWRIRDGARPDFLIATDTSSNILEWEVKDEGLYLVRMQPELLQGVGYKISIVTGPSIAFPIQKIHNPKVISVWGDPRDGNARKHEGIDILAKKGTPVVAVSKGVVTTVKEGGLGGKVVFFRPEGKDLNLYYAHLDTQLVTQGQRMNAGDALGTVGNTGNAKHTVAHLHFGIYTGGGAIDPLPFVNDNRPLPKQVNTDTSLLNTVVRIKAGTELMGTPGKTGEALFKLNAGQAVKAIAATNDFYFVKLYSGERGFIKKDLITSAQINRKVLAADVDFYDGPYNSAAVMYQLKRGLPVSVYGSYSNFTYISTGENKGWVISSELGN